MKTFRIAFLACLCGAFTALAQTDRGTITGTVQDQASAMVPGAKVTVRNAETGATSETVTTSTGNFTLAQLPAGKYELTVEAPDIDAYNHVNNAVYVTWCDRSAWEHSAALGLPIERCLELDRGMAVVRTVIQYLRPALLGDVVHVATWIVPVESRLRVRRRFQIKRIADDTTLARAEIEYVCIELSSGVHGCYKAIEQHVSIAGAESACDDGWQDDRVAAHLQHQIERIDPRPAISCPIDGHGDIHRALPGSDVLDFAGFQPVAVGEEVHYRSPALGYSGTNGRRYS